MKESSHMKYTQLFGANKGKLDPWEESQLRLSRMLLGGMSNDEIRLALGKAKEDGGQYFTYGVPAASAALGGIIGGSIGALASKKGKRLAPVLLGAGLGLIGGGLAGYVATPEVFRAAANYSIDRRLAQKA